MNASLKLRRVTYNIPYLASSKPGLVDSACRYPRACGPRSTSYRTFLPCVGARPVSMLQLEGSRWLTPGPQASTRQALMRLVRTAVTAKSHWHLGAALPTRTSNEHASDRSAPTCPLLHRRSTVRTHALQHVGATHCQWVADNHRTSDADAR